MLCDGPGGLGGGDDAGAGPGPGAAPRVAATRCASVITAIRPACCANSIAASTLGPMLPAANCCSAV